MSPPATNGSAYSAPGRPESRRGFVDRSGTATGTPSQANQSIYRMSPGPSAGARSWTRPPVNNSSIHRIIHDGRTRGKFNGRGVGGGAHPANSESGPREAARRAVGKKD